MSCDVEQLGNFLYASPASHLILNACSFYSPDLPTYLAKHEKW